MPLQRQRQPNVLAVEKLVAAAYGALDRARRITEYWVDQSTSDDLYAVLAELSRIQERMLKRASGRF